MELTAHLRQANRPQTPVRDLRLDYSKRWQHQHAVALLSAYKSSPYFDYYWDLLAPSTNGSTTFWSTTTWRSCAACWR